jgi:hypothetical protein
MEGDDASALARQLELDLQAEGMNPPDFRMNELIKTVGEKTPQVEIDDDRIKFGGEMLLTPEERSEHDKAVQAVRYDFSGDRPQRAHGEPFSEFSRRLRKYVANKSLNSEG